MILRAFLIVILAFSTACTAPRKLPGHVTEAVVEVPTDRLTLEDWQLAGRIAMRDGFQRIRFPAASNKPSPQELAELDLIYATNAKFYDHMESDDVLLRAQNEVVPVIESRIVQIAQARYNSPDESGKALRVVVRPLPGAISFRKELIDVAGFGSREVRLRREVFEAGVVLKSVDSGAIVDQKSVRFNVRNKFPGTTDYIDNLAFRIVTSVLANPEN